MSNWQNCLERGLSKVRARVSVRVLERAHARNLRPSALIAFSSVGLSWRAGPLRLRKHALDTPLRARIGNALCDRRGKLWVRRATRPRNVAKYFQRAGCQKGGLALHAAILPTTRSIFLDATMPNTARIGDAIAAYLGERVPNL